MKKIFILGVALFSFVADNFAQTTIVWDGGGTTNNFSEAANWVGDVLPQPGESVQFDNTSTKNCDFDASASIDIVDLTITSGYSGTIDGLSSTPIVNGSFSQAGGTFISTDDVSSGMIVGHNMTLTGGTFTHNSGLINLAVDAGTSTISGAFTFNYISISSNGTSGAQRNVDFGTCSTGTLELAGAARLYGYQGNVSITSELIVSGSNTGIPVTNSGAFTFSGAGPITITGASAAARNKLPNLVFNTTGNYSMTGHLNVQGNWTGTQGTLTVGSSTENFYGASAAISGTAAAFDNLNIQTGAVVTMPSSTEVTVGGTLTRTGTLTFPSTCVLGLNGTGAQSISGAALTLGGLHIHSGSRTITLSTGLSILDSVKVDANATFATGGNLTLKSTTALTARIAQIGASGSITGNVVVETAVPGGVTGWANLGVRGVTGQTIANWDTYVSSSAANGLPMSCVGCAYSPTVIGTGSNSFVSVQGWDEPNDTYTELTSSSILDPGTGIWAYVGDGQSSTGDLKLVNTGPLVQGALTIPLTAGGPGTGGVYQNLIANPYACPISWAKVFNLILNQLMVNPTIYVFNADNSSTTSYNVQTDASSHAPPNGIGDVIAGGQAFYVEYNNFGFPLDFDETVKVSNNTSSAPLLKTTAASVVPLFRLKVSGPLDWDETAFCIHENATSVYDNKFDARKIFHSPGYAGYPGAYSKYTTISSKDAFDADYSINTLPLLTSSVTVPVLVKVSTTGTYTIQAKDFRNFATCVGLIDKLNNSYHDLRQSPYVFTISDTVSSPRFELVLCKDESLNQTGVAENTNTWSNVLISQDQQGAFVKTAFDKNTKATISVYNLLGQKLIDDIQTEGTLNSTNLNLNLHNQVVLIRVSTDKQSTTKKLLLN